MTRRVLNKYDKAGKFEEDEDHDKEYDDQGDDKGDDGVLMVTPFAFHACHQDIQEVLRYLCDKSS